jgi:hypothetical protein
MLTICQDSYIMLPGNGARQMRTFDITQISELSGLTTGQIEQAISREQLEVEGQGRPRKFTANDAFTFCLIGELRALGLDWKRIVGSTSFPWPLDVADVFELDGNQFFLLRPISGYLDISLTTTDDILRDLRAFKASGAILIDASAIARRVEKTFARRR